MSDTGLHHVLFYDYVEDVLPRRAPHREAHLGLCRRWKQDGRLVMAGALGDPPHGGALVFRVEDPSLIEEFVAADPYIGAGIVTAWRVEPWNVVV
jgi:hypothetical protein